MSTYRVKNVVETTTKLQRMGVMTLFAKNLREARTARGLTQEGLAEIAGMSRVTIANYEGESAFPRDDTIDLIAKALKIDVSRLFYDPATASLPPQVVDQVAALARTVGLKVNGRG